MPEQSYTAEELWQRFREEFRKGLEEPCKGTSEERLWTAWCSRTARTHFYGGCLLPRVASNLGLDMYYEHYKVEGSRLSSVSADWIMVDGATKRPQILIESENYDKTGAEGVLVKEIPNLCRGTAALKILIVCLEWNETPGVWPPKGRERAKRSEKLGEWRQEIVQRLGHLEGRSETFGLIVGECLKQNPHILTFYSYDLTLDGRDGDWRPMPIPKRITRDEILFQCEMSNG